MKSLVFLLFIFLLSSCNENLIIESTLVKEGHLTDNTTDYYIDPNNLPGLLSTEYYKIKAYLGIEPKTTTIEKREDYYGLKYITPFVDANIHYETLKEEGSHFVLFSHFNSFQVEDGIKIKFERDKADLIIKASVKNSTWKLLLHKENYFLKSSELDLTVEVQNGTPEGAHIHIWENFRIKSNIIKQERQTLTKETLLADSEGINFYRQGEGLKWGLKLFRTQLIKGARVSPPLL